MAPHVPGLLTVIIVATVSQRSTSMDFMRSFLSIAFSFKNSLCNPVNLVLSLHRKSKFKSFFRKNLHLALFIYRYRDKGPDAGASARLSVYYDCVNDKKTGRVPEKNVNLNTLAERAYTLEAVCWYERMVRVIKYL